MLKNCLFPPLDVNKSLQYDICMIIRSFVEPPIDNNNYLLMDEASREAVLIDCSCYDEEIEVELKKYDAQLKYILLTHGHFDHITGLNDFAGKAPVLMHENDMEWIRELNTYLPMVGMPPMETPKINRFIKDNEILKLGSIEIKVIHTPGHTQGGVCFYADGNLFSGDTIFREAVGRCDLPGGDFYQIVESIEQRVFTLPDDTIIYPGHGSKTTVGWEKQHNQFL